LQADLVSQTLVPDGLPDHVSTGVVGTVGALPQGGVCAQVSSKTSLATRAALTAVGQPA
jgi:hypothetical protein